ncbi:MAG: hypothetical protein AB1724_15035 [Thermodesulfobacteriota bacterium]
MIPSCYAGTESGTIKRRGKGFHLPGTILPLCVLLVLLFQTAAAAQNRALPATAPRSRQLIDVSRADEPWVRDWDVTHTAVMIPGGGKAGFYDRPPRMGDAVPHPGRMGILYLYPESDYKPARILQRNVKVTPATAALLIGACANRTPRGEWNLRVLVDDKPLGGDVVISDRDGWRDIVLNLSGYMDRRVDIEIQGHTSLRRGSHIYIDYIELADPAESPVSELEDTEEDDGGPYDFSSTDFENQVDAGNQSDGPVYFDVYYENFLELMMERQDRRRYDDYYYNPRYPYYPPPCVRRYDDCDRRYYGYPYPNRKTWYNRYEHDRDEHDR